MESLSVQQLLNYLYSLPLSLISEARTFSEHFLNSRGLAFIDCDSQITLPEPSYHATHWPIHAETASMIRILRFENELACILNVNLVRDYFDRILVLFVLTFHQISIFLPLLFLLFLDGRMGPP